jgi:hypothetical protein
MRKQRNVGALNKSSIYDYDERITCTYALIKKELPGDDVKLIRRYDESMITQSLAKPTRHKHLQVILNLSRYLGKSWESKKYQLVETLTV